MEATRSPARFFPHETFLPGSEEGPAVFSFPYSVAAWRVASSPTVRDFLVGRPSWSHYLEEGHPARALHLAVAIAKHFAELAQIRGKQHLVMIFPTPSSFEYFLRNGTIATQPLSDALERAGIDHFDLYEGFSDYLGDRSYCELLTNPVSCSGHHNAEGNRLVANLVSQQMARKR